MTQLLAAGTSSDGAFGLRNISHRNRDILFALLSLSLLFFILIPMADTGSQLVISAARWQAQRVTQPQQYDSVAYAAPPADA